MYPLLVWYERTLWLASLSSSPFVGTWYILAMPFIVQAGKGPILHLSESAIRDQRDGTFYQVNGNLITRVGRGPMFEILGERIRMTYGSYVLEVSSTHIRRPSGEIIAAIEGNLILPSRSAERFEFKGDFNTRERLAMIAVLFANNL